MQSVRHVKGLTTPGGEWWSEVYVFVPRARTDEDVERKRIEEGFNNRHVR